MGELEDKIKARKDMGIITRERKGDLIKEIHDDDYGVCRISFNENGSTNMEPKDSCSKIFRKLEESNEEAA